MLTRIIITILFFLAAISPAFSQQKPYVRFLDELINLRQLAILPPAGETCKQFSSYDRASHDEETWSANNDQGHYLRKDDEGYVIAEMDGPGCIQRIWSANPTGTIKIYLDGAKKPVTNADFVELIKGNVPPFEPPLVGFRASGANCYMPIP